MLSRCFLDFSVGVGFFCHRTESDLFLFLLVGEFSAIHERTSIQIFTFEKKSKTCLFFRYYIRHDFSSDNDNSKLATVHSQNHNFSTYKITYKSNSLSIIFFRTSSKHPRKAACIQLFVKWTTV